VVGGVPLKQHYWLAKSQGPYVTIAITTVVLKGKFNGETVQNRGLQTCSRMKENRLGAGEGGVARKIERRI
jgi:hypothetical protein